MEVSVRLDAVGQHDRVVDGRGQLSPGDRRGVLDGVAGGAVHLGRAPQRVRVLHPVEPVLAMARHHPRPRQHARQVGGRDPLPHLGSERLELRGEDPVGAHLRLDAHRGGDVGGAQQPTQVGDREDQHPEHAVGAVDQRQALLGAELNGREAGRRERIGRGHQCAARVAYVALPHQHQRAVGERREVARAAERAVLPDDRGDPRREQRRHQLRRLASDAGVAGRQRREPQQHQPAHHLALHLGTGSRRVRADQGALELLAQLGRDVPGRQGAEPGRDPVRRGRGRGQLLDDRPCSVDRRERLVGQLDPGLGTCHGHHVVEGHRADAHPHALHAVIQLPAVTPTPPPGARHLSEIRDRSQSGKTLPARVTPGSPLR